MADQNGRDVEDIIAADDARIAATASNRPQSLTPFLHDELVFTHSTGTRHNRDELIEFLDTHLTYHDMKRRDGEVRVLSDIGIMTGRLWSSFAFDDFEREVDTAFLSVWRRTPEGWKLFAWQASPIAIPKMPPKLG